MDDDRGSASEKGWLAIVSTPIGNLEDITLRALRILKEADFIASEDTRRTQKLLTHYEINTATTSYHAHNEHKKTASLLSRVDNGENLALVTDAGTPCISDPGFFMVREAIRHGIEPEIIPGPSALSFCVAAAGLPVDRFYFAGYPPVKSGRRVKFLENLKNFDCTVFVYESPHKMPRLLTELKDVFQSDVPVAFIREATKQYEERIRGTVEELSEKLAGKNWKGEIVVALDLRGSDS